MTKKNHNNNIGIVLASGSGTRFGSKVPKQFVKMNGRYVVSYVIDELKKTKLFDSIYMTIPDLSYSYIAESLGVEYILGGETRNDTVQNVINVISEKQDADSCKILFHDGVRPLINSENIKICIEHLDTHDAVIASKDITDSIVKNHFTVVSRDDYSLIQTPEAFNFKELRKYFNSKKDFTAISFHLPKKSKIKKISLGHSNTKITFREDLYSLEQATRFSFPDISTKVFLKGKKVLLFGSSGGVGTVMKKELEKRGAVIVSIDRQKIDMSSLFLDTLKKQNIRDIDIIINASGVCYLDGRNILDNYEEIMNVNLRANLQLIEYAKYIQNKDKTRPIQIVMMSSSSGLRGRKDLSIYSASKATLHNLIESLHEDLAKNNIYINCVCPEKIDTPMLKKVHGEDYNKREVLSPESVVRAILLCLTPKLHGKIFLLRKGFC